MNGKFGFEFGDEFQDAAGLHPPEKGNSLDEPVLFGGYGSVAYGRARCTAVPQRTSDGVVVGLKGVIVAEVTKQGDRRPKCERECIKRHEDIHAADKDTIEACEDYRFYQWMESQTKSAKWSNYYGGKKVEALRRFKNPDNECKAWLDSLRCYAKAKCKYESKEHSDKRKQECPHADANVRYAARKVKKYCEYNREQMKVLLDEMERNPG